jgi:hypothetical protein
MRRCPLSMQSFFPSTQASIAFYEPFVARARCRWGLRSGAAICLSSSKFKPTNVVAGTITPWNVPDFSLHLPKALLQTARADPVR